MIVDLSILYGLLLLVTLLFTCLGRLFSGESDNRDTNFSKALVVGSIIVASIYALVSTGGKSILILTLWPLYKLYARPKYRLTELLQPFTVFAAYLLFTIILFVFYNPWSNIETDLFFYGTIAEWLPINGDENYFHYFQKDHSDLSGAMPYHYFELWIASLVNRLTGLSGVTALRYGVYPYFIVLVLYSMSSFFKNKRWMWFIGILALATLPINQLFNWIGSGVWEIEWSFLNRSNLLFYLLILVPAWEEYQQKNLKRASRWLMFLPIVSITTAPSIFVWMGLTLLYAWWREKVEGSVYLLLEWIGLGLLIASFYFLFGSSAKLQGQESLIELLAYSWSIKKAIIGVSGILILRLLLVSILLWGVQRRIGYHKEGLWAIGLAIVGVVEFQLLGHVDNMYQIPYVAYTLLWAILIISIFKSIAKLNVWIQVLTVVVLCLIAAGLNKAEFRFGSEESLGRWAFVSHGHSVDSGFDIRELNNRPRVLFVLPKEMSELGFTPKRRQALTSQLGSEFHWLINRLELYPATPSVVLFGDSADYSKAIAFNRYLKFYTDEKENAETFAKNNSYHWIIQSKGGDLTWEEIE